MSNTVQIIPWDSQSREDWKLQRTALAGKDGSECRIGASDIATLTGHNAWKSKRRLFLALVGIYEKEYYDKRTIMGHRYEPMIADLMGYWDEDEEVFIDNLYFKRRQRKFKQAEFFVLNSKFPAMSCSLDYIPDGEVYSPWTGNLYEPLTPLEIKYIQEFVYKTWDEACPQHYMDQLQAQMALTETEVAIFAPYTNTDDLYPVEVERNNEYIQYLDHVTREFAIQVTKGKIIKAKLDVATDGLEIHDLNNELEDLTPIDPIEDSEDLAKELMTSGDDYLEIEPEGKEERLIKEYQMVTEDEKDLKGRKHAIKAELTGLADGYAGLESENFRVIIRGHNHPTKGAYFRIYNK